MMYFTDSLIHAYQNHATERASRAPEPFKVAARAEMLKLLKAEKRETLLEIGCGPGHDAIFFQEQGLRVLAVDNTPMMIDLTAERGVPAQLVDCYDLATLSTRFDAVWTMNCLLHIPKRDFRAILGLIAERLNENGVMYLGLWGDQDFEGIWEADSYTPKRFFSFWRTADLLAVLQELFHLEYYRRIVPTGERVFNSIILRKR